MEKKILIAVFVLLLIALPVIVSADQVQLLCLGKGERAEFSKCNPKMEDFVSTSDLSSICVTKKASGVYCPASPNVCNNAGINGCSYLDDSTSFDATPPVLTVINPINNFVYDSRYINFHTNTDEIANVYYYDNINGRGVWTRLCLNCKSYSGRRSFKDGLNNLTIRAVDLFGNAAYKNTAFYVDSKIPLIVSTTPKKGFADGNFNVTFKEANPESLVLRYGNFAKGNRTKNVNLDDCISSTNGKSMCSVNVDLKDFDGSEIVYEFILTDIAGSTAKKKPLTLNVDTTIPKVNKLNYTIKDKSVTFNISIVENNFDEVAYYDNSESRPKWKVLCTRLSDGNCFAKKSFSYGEHDLDIQIKDEAGNVLERNVDFII